MLPLPLSSPSKDTPLDPADAGPESEPYRRQPTNGGKDQIHFEPGVGLNHQIPQALLGTDPFTDHRADSGHGNPHFEPGEELGQCPGP